LKTQIFVPVGEANQDLDLCLRSLEQHLPNNCSVSSGEGCSGLWQPGNDLLLLSPHTQVTAGFLEEMQAVLHLHERHAVVAPRTNGSGFLSFPADEWTKLHGELPRYQLVSAIQSLCVLIKGEVLERFGLFEITPTVDAVNEFIARINRFGYSTLAANRVYVFNAERSPEFQGKISDYGRFQIDPLEHFASLYSAHRPRILYDLYHLPAQHSGTSDFALNLLREIEPLAREEYDIYVGAGADQAFFLTELCGYRLHDEQTSAPMLFDLVYKPCQIFRWHEFARMNRLAPRVAFTLQDIIALRCDYIGNASLAPLFQRTVAFSDQVFTISEFSRSDFAAYYGSDVPMQVIYHGSHARVAIGETAAGKHILMIGNARAHKGLSEAVRYLGDDWPLVVVGGDRLSSGQLSRRFMHDVFAEAKIVVYPSYYEGYGLPVADALALGKPVVVLDTAVNREIARNGRDPNLHRVSSLNELKSAVQGLWDEPPRPANSCTRRWSDAAAEYLAAFRMLLDKDIDLAKMRSRWETIRLIESLGPS
jgi:glycosyltransferase involved in cell wall biosynthesis